MVTAPAVVVTGASGLVGRALARHHPIVPMVRGVGTLAWNPTDGSVHDDGRPIAAVVHLAGASVAAQRWSPARQAVIRDSRVRSTRAMVDWISARPQRPSVFVCASAVGFYGDRGDQVLYEDAPQGRGFLSDVCGAWEAEAMRASQAGIRTVMLRFGVVLSPSGGSLEKMLPAFRVGAGGPLGGGEQWFSWIHEDDAARVILHVIRSPTVSGPVNAVAPESVRQRDFAKALGHAVGRPAVVPAPKIALRAAFGRGIADELLLASQQVRPSVLRRSEFVFAHPHLGGALADIVGD